MKTRDFAAIEAHFSRLLLALGEIFSETEIDEVTAFIDAGEYGLALDTVADIFVEERKVTTDEITVLTGELATCMRLPADDYVERVRTGGIHQA